MQPLVIDASFTFRLWTANPQRETAHALFGQWFRDDRSLVAPTLWLYEMTSALVKAVHFGALSDVESRQSVSLLHSFPVELIEPDPNLTAAAYAWSLRLQRANAYDAFYLALAHTLGVELWTADQRLYRAAQQPWVHVLG